jgi:hypothetical protein
MIYVKKLEKAKIAQIILALEVLISRVSHPRSENLRGIMHDVAGDTTLTTYVVESCFFFKAV